MEKKAGEQVFDGMVDEVLAARVADHAEKSGSETIDEPRHHQDPKTADDSCCCGSANDCCTGMPKIVKIAAIIAAIAGIVLLVRRITRRGKED